jgi:hypothetical protein
MSQSLKLGLAGFETELPIESRINAGEENELIEVSAQAVSGKIHTDFTDIRRVFTIQWDVNTQATKKILMDHVKSQISNNAFLSFIQTDKDDIEETIQVKATVPSFGTLLPSGEFYNFGTALILTETL